MKFSMFKIASLVLALMVLVSPCSVRNSIERALGIETTEVTNKIKAAPCAAFDQVAVSEVRSELSCDSMEIVAPAELATAYTSTAHTTAVKYAFPFAGESPHIPLYILYQSKKAYLS